jgi:phytoene dehydrogenase-like protein
LRGEALAGPGPVGGATALIAALDAAVRARGVEVRTGCAVRRLLVESGCIRGVELGSGEQIAADRVAAACHPTHLLLELLEPGLLSSRLTDGVRCYRTRGTTGYVTLALSTPPRFAARPGEPIEFARTGARLDDLERAFDAIKYDRIAAEPVLDLHVPTHTSPSLAPTGAAVLSVQVHFVPYRIASGWRDGERERLADHVVARLERHAPGLTSTILGRQVLVPADLESRYGLCGGSIHHGEHAIDQLLVRPTAGCARYRTPVSGLWLCGSGSHPGGGLTCLPGALAAKAILRSPRGGSAGS